MVAQNKKEKNNNIANKQTRIQTKNQENMKTECANQDKLARHLTQKVFFITIPINEPVSSTSN